MLPHHRSSGFDLDAAWHEHGPALPQQEPAQAVVDDRVVLATALATLSSEHREVLVAVNLEGLTYAELAERHGVPVATLRTRSYHACAPCAQPSGRRTPPCPPRLNPAPPAPIGSPSSSRPPRATI